MEHVKKALIISLIGALLALIFFKDIFFTNLSYFQRDTLTLFYPWMAFSKECLRNLTIPLWNPFTDCGMPFLASMQPGVFYPLNLPFYIFDFTTAYKIYIFIHFFLAYIFMFLLLKDFGFKDTVALAGAVIWTFSGSMITRIEFFSVMGSTIYLPLELLFLKKMASSEQVHFRIRYGILLSAVIAVQFFAGHPQEFMYSIFFLVCYLFAFVIPASFRHSRASGNLLDIFKRPISDFVLVLLFACLLSAVQLVPSAEFIANSSRVNTQAGSSGLNYEQATQFSINFKELRNIIYPFFYKEQVLDKVKNEKIVNIPHLWIFSFHIGIIAFFFALAGIILNKNKHKYFFGFMVVACTILSMGNYFPLYRLIYKIAFPLRFIRHPATIIYLSVFSLCILACYGLDKISKKYVPGLICVLIFAELFFYGHQMNLAMDSRIYSMCGPNIKFLCENSGLQRFAHTPLTHVRTRSEGRNLFDSFVNYKDKLFGNVSMTYHLFNFYGQDTDLGDFRAYLDRAYSKSSPDAANKLFSLANVKYLLNYREFNSPSYRLAEKGSLFIYENKNCLPRAFIVSEAKYMPKEKTLEYIDSDTFDPGKEVALAVIPAEAGIHGVNLTIDSHLHGNDKIKSSVSIKDYQPNKIIINAETASDCWLVLLDTYYPGWKAYINGRKTEIYRANYLFRAVNLQKGSNTVVFKYSPLTLKIGFIITLLSVISIILFKLKQPPKYRSFKDSV